MSDWNLLIKFFKMNIMFGNSRKFIFWAVETCYINYVQVLIA